MIIEKTPASAELAKTSSPKLSVHGISKTYGTTTVLQSLDLDVRDGELLTLLGPSGSGKTTLLQINCGLVEPTSGQLLIDGHDQTVLPVNQRDIGVVFQHYALFPHLTVGENVAFPLRMRRVDRSEIDARVKQALDMVNLGHAIDRLPKQLSGGQQQRVALARCLVYRPGVILMDEPLGALDRKLRETMQMEIKRIHRETGATIVFVTHDQEEALALSDRICLMNDGKIEQIGTPQEIYEYPVSSFAADFIGLSNIFTGTVADGWLTCAEGRLSVAGDIPQGAERRLVVRPEHVRIAPQGQGFIDGTVKEQVYAGSETRLIVEAATGAQLIARQPAGSPSLQLGAPVSLSWDAKDQRLLDR